MSPTLLILGGATLLIAILLNFIRRNRPPREFPPGPTPLPILGNLHQIGLEPHKNFITLGKKYGGLFGIDYGSYRSVVVNDLKLLKECLSNPAFAGRPKFRFFLDRTSPGIKYARGIITSEGRHWAPQRRFTLKNLRDFGFGKSSMEEIIQDEVQEFIEGLRMNVGQPISTRGIFNAAVLNSLWRLCTGARIPQNDPKLQTIMKHVMDIFNAATPLIFFYPVLIKWFPGLTGYNTAIEASNALNAFVKAEYNAHQQTFSPEEPRDLMDAMIAEVLATTDPTSSFYKEEGEASVMKSLEDLFLAGAETTSTTLSWLSLSMALFPEIQDKLFHEIQNVIGATRTPELIDRKNMPYTECVLMEVMRYVAVFPLSFMHCTTEEVRFGGYTIPKDTVVTPNLYAVMHNEGIWGDPKTFRPERFILPDGTANRNHEAFIPFSYGKRVCIGEKFAKDELFLFAVSLFQQFRITTNPKGPLPSFQTRLTVVLSPRPHELILHNRF